MSMSERERNLREQVTAQYRIMKSVMDKYEAGETVTKSDRDDFDNAKIAYDFAETELRSMGKSGNDDDVGRATGQASYEPTEEDRAFDSYLRIGDTHGLHELRVSTGWTTQASDTANAAYTVPQGFWVNLQVALKAYGGVSADYKLVETDNGRAMPWPTIDPTGQTASLVGTELTQLSTASPFVFGTGTLNAWTYATNPVLISLQALQDSEFDLGGFLAERIGEQLGRSFAAAAISGTGSSQPQGIITGLNTRGTAGTVGGAITATGGFVTLATAASVKTFAAPAGATELVGNVLSPATCLAMVSAVDPAYYGAGEGCKWYMNNTMAMNQHGVIDSQGRPLLNFESGYQDGAVGTMLGFPVVVDNNLPNIAASTTGGPVFGNLGNAMVRREVRYPSVMRLQERYADQLAVGFIGFHRIDYRSNDMRAAVTVKPAAT